MRKEGTRLSAFIDLIIIAIISFAAFSFYYIYKQQIVAYVADSSQSVLERTVLTGFLHFGVAGLGMCVVMLFRGERLGYIGFSKNELTNALKYSFMLALIFVGVTIFRGVWRIVYPFRQQWLTEIFLDSSLPVMALGMIFSMIMCGMFEGINYAYISKKLNTVFPVKNVFLSPGPILMGILGFASHALLGLNGWQHSLQTLFLVYGMMIVYEKTNNVVGCAVVFGLLWNLL